MHCYCNTCNTTQRSAGQRSRRRGRTGRRRHGGQRRRELRVEIRRGAGAGAPGVRAFAGSWTKPAESIDAALFRDCASSALFRRVAEMTNFDLSSNTRLPTSRTCAAISGKPVLRGGQDKIQSKLRTQPASHHSSALMKTTASDETDWKAAPRRGRPASARPEFHPKTATPPSGGRRPTSSES